MNTSSNVNSVHVPCGASHNPPCCSADSFALAISNRIGRVSGLRMIECSVVPWATVCSSRFIAATLTGVPPRISASSACDPAVYLLRAIVSLMSSQKQYGIQIHKSDQCSRESLLNLISSQNSTKLQFKADQESDSADKIPPSTGIAHIAVEHTGRHPSERCVSVVCRAALHVVVRREQRVTPLQPLAACGIG